MGTLSQIGGVRPTERGRAAANRPSLRVTVQTETGIDDALGVVSILAGVSGARAPVRLYLYVDGDLVGSWTGTRGRFDLSADEYGPGRHAVMARAVDAFGRWAGASIVVAGAWSVAGEERS